MRGFATSWPHPGESPRRASAPIVASLVVVAACSAGVVLFVTRTSYDIWGWMLVAPLLALVSLPLLRRVSRGPDEQWLFRVLVLALAAKLIGTFVRYAVVETGGGDAIGYDLAGSALADVFRAREWDSPVLDDFLPQLTGTPFIRLVIGLVYTVTGPTILGGFVFFSWLGFLGQVLFISAFRLAIPTGHVRRYAVLVLFLPSLLFWPSSIGKESWMLLCLGACAYGAARLLTNRRGGIPILAAALLGTAMVRPHITLIIFAALFTAYLIRRPTSPTALHRAGKVVGILALVVGGLFIAGAVQNFFGLEGLDAEAVDLVLDETGRRSTQGGSEFDNIRATSPARYPSAVVQVLFRPFPFEANSAQAIVASIEGLVLLGLFVASLPRLARLPLVAVRQPYVTFAIAFAALFVLAFSAIGNFGILVRQRTQVYPFVLVAVALPLAGVAAERSQSRAAARSARGNDVIRDPSVRDPMTDRPIISSTAAGREVDARRRTAPDRTRTRRTSGAPIRKRAPRRPRARARRR
jgi:hypothetical protein